jgi:hypothetical protein
MKMLHDAGPSYGEGSVNGYQQLRSLLLTKARGQLLLRASFMLVDWLNYSHNNWHSWQLRIYELRVQWKVIAAEGHI